MEIISTLHPYDGVERRFRHTDPDPSSGLAAAAKLLRLPQPPPPDGLLYDISFYSGGAGILDRLALSIPATPALWTQVITSLDGRTPEAAAANPAWSEDFLWLVTVDGDAELPRPRAAALQFINAERKSFQPECRATDRIFFQHDSNVNDWIALWGDDSRLNYLGYGQG